MRTAEKQLNKSVWVLAEKCIEPCSVVEGGYYLEKAEAKQSNISFESSGKHCKLHGVKQHHEVLLRISEDTSSMVSAASVENYQLAGS